MYIYYAKIKNHISITTVIYRISYELQNQLQPEKSQIISRTKNILWNQQWAIELIMINRINHHIK